MMGNEFDELIRNKVEKTEYHYSRQAWRTFCRKANMPAVATSAKVGIAIAATAGAVTAAALLWPSTPEPGPAVSPSLPAPALTVADTLAADTMTADTAEVAIDIAPRKTTKIVSKKSTTPTPEAAILPDTVPAPETVVRTQEKVKREKVRWRVSPVIDVDTVAPY